MTYMSLTIRKLTNKDKLIKAVRKLYIQSFPANERIPFPIVLRMAAEDRLELLAFFDGEVFAGFVCMYHSERMCFLYYLAVPGELRDQGYGSRILQGVQEYYQSLPIVAEIDTPDESAEDILTRKKRQSFYQRNGFRMTSVRYLFYGADYTLMVHGREISRSEFADEAEMIYPHALRIRYIDPLPVPVPEE